MLAQSSAGQSDPVIYPIASGAKDERDPTRQGARQHPRLAARAPSWREQSFRFVPQGGGNMRESHCCPGERATVELVKEAVRQLCRAMRYEVPPQDLSISRSRIPAGPASGVVLGNIGFASPPGR